MLAKETIQLKAVTCQMEDGKLVVTIKIFNPEDRTVYAYGSLRRIFYDNAAKKLTLLLHDQHLSADEVKQYSPHLRQPRFVSLEAKTETELKLKLDPTLNRMRSAVERGDGPLLEQMPISEAKQVQIEIAHQDTPFYYNPSIDNAKQLRDWGNVVKGTFKITPAQAGTEAHAE